MDTYTPKSEPPAHWAGRYDHIPSWWLEICPDNLDPDLCYFYLAGRSSLYEPEYHDGWGGTSTEMIISMVSRLAQLWDASGFKRSNLNNPAYFSKCRSDVDWIRYGDEYFGPMPIDIFNRLLNYVESLKPGLKANCDTSMYTPRYEDERFITYPEETINNIMDFITSNPIETIHYVGYMDLGLLKSLVGQNKYKISLMDMSGRFHDRGYTFDKDMNLFFEGRPGWLEGLPIYDEGAPNLIDCYIRDCAWSPSDQLDKILHGRTPRQPRYLVLLLEAIEHGKHDYYSWKFIKNVNYGKLKKEHALIMSKEERTFRERSDKFMRGERDK